MDERPERAWPRRVIVGAVRFAIVVAFVAIAGVSCWLGFQGWGQS